MNIRMRTPLLLAFVTLLLACGGSEEAAPDAKMVEANRRIRAMEDSLFEHRAFDQRSAQAMVDIYKAYALAYPNDSMAPEYLFRAAGTLKSMHQADNSIVLYDRLIREHPSWKRLVDVLYMRALTLDDDLDRLGEARTAYQLVITTFPDHPFARDAKVMIENLGLSDEELIQRFKQKEREDSAATAAAP